LKAGNIDSNDTIFNVGYNYALSSRDTIGVLYRFIAFRYPGNPQALNDHVVQAAYGRKITGRLALQIFGGPEISTSRALVGSTTPRVGGSGGAALGYASGRNNLTLSYLHAVSGGGGALFGSSTDEVQIELGRELSRHWQGSVSFGYARNGSLGNLGVSQNSGGFNSYYIGSGLSRTLGRDSKLSLAYASLIQTSNQAVCAAGTCSTTFTQHQIALGFSWHTRPFVLR